MTKRDKNWAFKVLPYVAFLATLTLINVVVFYNSIRGEPFTCTTDSILQSVAIYFAHNGEFSLDKFLPQDCTKVSDKIKSELIDSVSKLASDCFKVINKPKGDETYPIITLFTTHAAHSHIDSEKYLVHNNTLINWALFKKMANLVLFTNDSSWASIAEERDWEVIRTAEAETPPLLKEMFTISKSHYNTPWYGYINADILLTRTFIQTLESIAHKYNASSERVLLIGRRINVNDLLSIDASSDSNVRDTAKTFGKLYREDAEDYFIVSKVFPWNGILPVVVGIPGYDNWLVQEARCHLNTTVIDVTETLEAVHQTTKRGGNAEGHSHSHVNFNFEVFKKANVTPNFIAGLTECAEYKTYRTLCDTVEIHKRTDLGKGCKCKKR